MRIHTKSAEIHKVGTYTEKKYKTYVEKRYIGSRDIHERWGYIRRVEIHTGNRDTNEKWRHKQKVGTNTKLRYIQKRDIRLIRRRDKHGV